MKKRFFLVTMLLASLAVGSTAYASEQGTTMEVVTEEGAPQETEVSQQNYTQGGPAEIAKEEIMEKMNGNLQSIGSIRTGLEMNLEGLFRMGGEASDTGMEMTMNISASLENEEIFEPYQAHSVETFSIEMLGESQKQITQRYVRNEDGQIAEYKGTADENGQVAFWDREVEEDLHDTEFFFDRSGNFFDSMPELTLNANKVVDAEGKEYYLLEGQIDLEADDGSGENLSDQIEELIEGMEDGMGDLELPSQLPISFYISANDLLPAEVMVDVSGIRGKMAEDSYNAEIEFTEFTVGMNFRDYNAVGEIAFPENLNGAVAVDQQTAETAAPTGETTAPETAAPETAAPAGETAAQESAAAEGASVAYSANGALETPLALNEMGKAFVYNSESGNDEAAGLTVTGVKGGEEVAQYVDELLNAEDSYYTFPALRRTEEYRLVSYDLYFPLETTDSKYGLYNPGCHFEVVGEDGDYLYINGRSYYAATVEVYDEDGEYHPGDTVHCETIIVMPKDTTEYVLKFGSYDTEPLYVKVG